MMMALSLGLELTVSDQLKCLSFSVDRIVAVYICWENHFSISILIRTEILYLCIYELVSYTLFILLA